MGENVSSLIGSACRPNSSCAAPAARRLRDPLRPAQHRQDVALAVPGRDPHGDVVGAPAEPAPHAQDLHDVLSAAAAAAEPAAEHQTRNRVLTSLVRTHVGRRGSTERTRFRPFAGGGQAIGELKRLADHPVQCGSRVGTDDGRSSWSCAHTPRVGWHPARSPNVTSGSRSNPSSCLGHVTDFTANFAAQRRDCLGRSRTGSVPEAPT